MSIHLTLNDITYTDINLLIEDYMPFIISEVSHITKRYVSLENDEELSIGLMAFYEAIQKYNEDKGAFIPFAKLVMRSRLKNHFKSEGNSDTFSLDSLTIDQIEAQIEPILEPHLESENLVADEINFLTSLLLDFGFNLTDVAKESPKHTQTRKNAIDLSERISFEPMLTHWLYLKKRLPISQICLQFNVTQKIIKHSKKFIITTVIIFDKNLRNLKLWIER
ncbi:MAG: sigma factor [Cellulosilyticaceae bacterium]